jgi:hypothetical protein
MFLVLIISSIYYFNKKTYIHLKIVTPSEFQPDIPPYIPVEYSHPKKYLLGIDNNIPGLIPDNGKITIGDDLGLNGTILSLYD